MDQAITKKWSTITYWRNPMTAAMLDAIECNLRRMGPSGVGRKGQCWCATYSDYKPVAPAESSPRPAQSCTRAELSKHALYYNYQLFSYSFHG